jgi:hypothetical protein
MYKVDKEHMPTSILVYIEINMCILRQVYSSVANLYGALGTLQVHTLYAHELYGECDYWMSGSTNKYMYCT